MASRTDDVYITEIIDSVSGRSRAFYLFDGLSEQEWKGVYQAGFDFELPTVGLKDDLGVYYPLSALSRLPKLFHRRKLFVVFQNSNESKARGFATIGNDSEDTIVTEEHVRFAFAALDVNGDGQVHKEEFIEMLAAVLENLFAADEKTAFAYSCLTPTEIAICAATACYGSVGANDSAGYYLKYADFSSWYMSGGSDPLRSVMVRALQFFEAEDTEESGRKLRRDKSSPNLGSSRVYDDSAVNSYFALGRRMLHFSETNLEAISKSFDSQRNKKISNYLTHAQVKSIISALLEESVRKNASKPEVREIIGRFIQTVIDILDGESNEEIHIGQLFSLLQLANVQQDFSVFKSIFHWYRSKLSSKKLAYDAVLFDHLKTIVRVIFYFNPNFVKVCNPDLLAHGIFLKLLLSVEVTRRDPSLLDLNEFVELFVHGLRLLLSILSIQEGYFSDMLQSLVGYQIEKVRLGEDAGYSSTSIDHSSVIMSPTGDSLEDDQVASYLVGYNGSTMSVGDAREALGLFEYTGYDMVKYVMQLSDDSGKIDSVTFSRGILKLIGEHYVELSVLQRSVVDFILDRVSLTFDPKQQGCFDMLEICIALLLFCEDDEYSRPEVILALLRPKVLKFSTVRAVVVILFQMCFSLNPSAQPSAYLAEAESDANAMCIAYYMRKISSKSDMQVNFTNTQFLDFLGLVLSFLEEESTRRRDAADDVVSYERDDQSAAGDASDNGQDVLQTFSEDEASNGFLPYLKDSDYPPSSVVLELRAASSILGLEQYTADDLIDKLGGESKAGRLDHHGWARWLGSVFQSSEVSKFDIDLAIFIGHKIFNAFQHDEMRTARYSHIAIGLAFLCSKSPLEERLMVAFTLADEDSDGFLSFHDFCTLIKSVLTVISVCSKLIEGKISALGVTLAELSKETALQGMQALGLGEEDEISLEMLSDLAEDYLKLAAFV